MSTNHNPAAKVVIICLLSFLFSFRTVAQDRAIINAVVSDPSDLTAASGENLRRDLSGRPCALVKVSVIADDVKFTGNIVDTLSRGSEYWVYMTEGVKELRISSSLFKTTRIYFPDYDIPELKPEQTYLVDLSVPRNQGALLIMKVIPADSRVFIDGKEVEVTDGVAMHPCRVGKHSYSVQAQGYKTDDGKFSITDKKNLNTTVKLKAVTNIKVSPFWSPAGKIGFRDQNGKTVVKPEYDKVMPSADIFWVIKKGKYGMIDQQGELLAQCAYDNVLTSKVDGLFIVCQDGKYGVINSYGWQTIPCMLDKISTTSTDLMVGIMDGQFGLISTDGELVIPCDNEEITDFFDGMAGIRRNGKCGFINTDGELVIPMIYDGVTHFSGGVARVTLDGSYDYIDKTGKSVGIPSSPVSSGN